MVSEFDAKKILVIRLSSLGDVVLTTALFPSLQARWPQARISVATKTAFAPIFDRNPHVHEVFSFGGSKRPFSELVRQVKAGTWDVVIDLHGTPRSWFLRLIAGGSWTVTIDKATLARHLLVQTKLSLPKLQRSVRERILDCLSGLGVSPISSDTRLFPADATAFLSQHGVAPGTVLIGVAPGARHATKRWPAERFAEAANQLAEARSATVVILGDGSDEESARKVQEGLSVPCVNLAGKTRLSELIAVTAGLSYLLTNDSGLLHIGEALKIPLSAVFGPTVRAFGFAPYRDTSHLVETDLRCRPCTLHGNEQCPLGHHKCMNDIAVETVVAASRGAA